MATDMKPNIKQLKVDNWGTFFLQRLQLLFAKGDFCDLTLKFKDGQELKVHRLVLNTCTSYFEKLSSSESVIDLPETLSYQGLHPIINFMYSGQLEFRPDLQSVLLSTAKALSMTILIKLLNAQRRDIECGKLVEVKKVGTPSLSPAKPTVLSKSPMTPIGGKKLPIWRKRSIPVFRNLDSRRFEEEEDPKPTRFEWPGDDDGLLLTTPSFTPISYESTPVFQSPAPASPTRPKQPLKRRVMPATNHLPDKSQKLEGSQNGLISQDNANGPELSDDDDDDDGHFETLHTYDDSDDETPDDTLSMPTSTPKPILKPSAETHTSTPLKKVRFSLENDDKENSESVKEGGSGGESGASMDVIHVSSEGSGKPESVTNHAKIIAEVLKKFPDLVKNSKNIKLKITSPAAAGKVITGTSTGKSATKASYVLVKTSAAAGAAIKTDKPPLAQTSGPWSCSHCVSNDEALNFESYSDYRKHLQEVHMEKFDSRICEQCGYKASKRNLHLYHMYTKHNVPPPRNVKFPKCNQCEYIALTETLLAKHKNTHQSGKEHACHICSTTFKTSHSLQAHIVTCRPNNEVRNYSCKICNKSFRTNNSLNAHSKECTEKKEESESGETMEMIEVPVIETVSMDSKGQHTLLQLPSGILLAESPNMTIIPTSEGGDLSNVATSIGLTVALPEDQAVILLDENSEFFLQGNNTFMVSKGVSQEYIVPDILDSDDPGSTTIYTQGYGEVLAYPVMEVSQGTSKEPDRTPEKEKEAEKEEEEESSEPEKSSEAEPSKSESEPEQKEKEVEEPEPKETKFAKDWDFEENEEEPPEDPELRPSRANLEIPELED